MSGVAVQATDIPGLRLVDLVVHADERGWFKENWQRRTMVHLGLPDFGPVQHNVSFNGEAGTTRGIHAEPWDKLVSVVTGRVFCAWVDLREGDGFGRVVTAELDVSRAAFVPRGVANAYQTLADGTAYSYLVNDHWSRDVAYTFVNLADPALAVPWPLTPTAVSDADRRHPLLAEVTPVPRARTVVVGADGQLGRALLRRLPDAIAPGLDELDLTVPETVEGFDWSGVDTVINAAAFTAVDAAETAEGRRAAWAVNVGGTVALARAAIAHDLTLVSVSSDYVFDGEDEVHDVHEPVAPLGTYGATKAAAEAVASLVPKHHTVRTTWLVGDGPNFVATMRRLADEGVSPRVVDDQRGRLTTADELADAILDLLASGTPYGLHHATGTGPVESWADVARRVFAEQGRDPADVVGISTEQYVADQAEAGRRVAPRPRNSALF